jgi:hypothetical protein
MKNQKTKKRNDNKYKVTKKRKYRKKIIGGWRKNKPAYYIDGWGVVPPPNIPNAIEIGKFLINSELAKYLLEDNYYGNNINRKHTDEEGVRKLKLQLIKSKFTNDEDYEWVGMQFYYIVGNQNPMAGYATQDDGVMFFDWLTNTQPRNYNNPIPYTNPLKLPVPITSSPLDTSTIPPGIVNQGITRYSSQPGT